MATKKKADKKADKKEEEKCTFTRPEVTSIVLDVLREKLDADDIKVDSDFEDDVGVDTEAKGLLFIPLKKELKRDGCKLKKFSPTTCEKAKTPKDMIDAICKDFGIT